MSSLNYIEFQKKTISEKSAFHRKNFDWFTNLIRWIALRFSYVLYRLGLSGNIIDVIGILFPLIGFILISTAVSGEKLLPSLGVLMIHFHVFIDFVDGPISRATGRTSKIGGFLDDMGCFVDRCVLLVLLGILGQSTSLLLVNAFTAGICVFSIPLIYPHMPKEGWIGRLTRLFVFRYSFLSVRIMLGILPAFLLLVIFKNWNLPKISLLLSAFYGLAALVWLILCVFSQYGNRRRAS